jgi:hypothetical protein
MSACPSLHFSSRSAGYRAVLHATGLVECSMRATSTGATGGTSTAAPLSSVHCPQLEAKANQAPAELIAVEPLVPSYGRAAFLFAGLCSGTIRVTRPVFHLPFHPQDATSKEPIET